VLSLPGSNRVAVLHKPAVLWHGWLGDRKDISAVNWPASIICGCSFLPVLCSVVNYFQSSSLHLNTQYGKTELQSEWRTGCPLLCQPHYWNWPYYPTASLYVVSFEPFLYKSRPMSCKPAWMSTHPVTFLWLSAMTDHEPHCWHMPTNTIWRRTQSTPQSGWWCWNLQRLQHSRSEKSSSNYKHDSHVTWKVHKSPGKKTVWVLEFRIRLQWVTGRAFLLSTTLLQLSVDHKPGPTSINFGKLGQLNRSRKE